MSDTDRPNDSGAGKPGGRQPGSQLLIGFCVAVLVLFAVMLNNPAKVAEWGARVFGWKTPKEECIMNLKRIDGAVQQWALENKKLGTDPYSLTDTNVLSYLRDSILPRCPLGGRYAAAPDVNGAPTCTVPGHTL